MTTAEQSGGGRPTPWVVGLLGVALTVGGWKLSTYVPGPGPKSKRAIENEKLLERLRDATEKSERAGGDPSKGKLGEALRELSRKRQSQQEPPYKVQGQLVLYGGLLLFIVAGVLMYRHQPAPEKPPEP